MARSLFGELEDSELEIVPQKFVAKKTKEVAFTKSIAKKLLKMEAFKGDRNVRPSHLKRLRRESNEGTMLWDYVVLAIARCSWDGVERRINGQHTCRVRLEMTGPNPRVTIKYYEVDTPDELAELYAKLDRGAPRTKTDVARARLMGDPKFNNVPPSYLGQLSSSHRAWFGIDDVDLSCDLLVDDHYSLAKKVLGVIKPMLCDDRALDFRRAPVFAAAFEMYSKSQYPAKVIDGFWDKVCTGQNIPTVDDPVGRLRTWMSKKTSTWSQGRSKKVRVSGQEMFNACIYAFNNYVVGNGIRLIRSTNKSDTRFDVD